MRPLQVLSAWGKSALVVLPLWASISGLADAQGMLTYEQVRLLAASQLPDPPPNPITVLEVVGVHPDLIVLPGQRKVTPVLNVEVLFRVKEHHTGYGILSVKIRPVLNAEGALTLEQVESGLVDLRVNERKSIANVGRMFGQDWSGNLMRVALSSQNLVPATAIPPLGSIRTVRFTRDGIELGAGTSSGLDVTADLGPADLNPREINHTVGNAPEAALIVELFDGHLNYYRAYALHVNQHGAIVGMGAHEDSDAKLRGTGLQDVGGARDQNTHPGTHLITLYLQNGQTVLDLRRKDQPGWNTPGYHWNDRIGSIRIRPGPRHQGERLEVFLDPDLKGRSRTLPVGDHALAADQYDGFFGTISSFRVSSP